MKKIELTQIDEVSETSGNSQGIDRRNFMKTILKGLCCTTAIGVKGLLSPDQSHAETKPQTGNPETNKKNIVDEAFEMAEKEGIPVELALAKLQFAKEKTIFRNLTDDDRKGKEEKLTSSYEAVYPHKLKNEQKVTAHNYRYFKALLNQIGEEEKRLNPAFIENMVILEKFCSSMFRDANEEDQLFKSGNQDTTINLLKTIALETGFSDQWIISCLALEQGPDNEIEVAPLLEAGLWPKGKGESEKYVSNVINLGKAGYEMGSYSSLHVSENSVLAPIQELTIENGTNEEYINALKGLRQNGCIDKPTNSYYTAYWLRALTLEKGVDPKYMEELKKFSADLGIRNNDLLWIAEALPAEVIANASFMANLHSISKIVGYKSFAIIMDDIIKCTQKYSDSEYVSVILRLHTGIVNGEIFAIDGELIKNIEKTDDIPWLLSLDKKYPDILRMIECKKTLSAKSIASFVCSQYKSRTNEKEKASIEANLAELNKSMKKFVYNDCL